ncbi:MAG: acyltransferase family protein [Bacteroidota bacterium]
MRNFGLDLLRCISIWFVIIEHAGIEVTGISRLKIGTIGVEIFFVISGFLIGGILLRDIDKGNPLFITLKNFWIRRWFRILPLYYGVLIFQYIFIDNTVGKNIIYYFLFLQNNFYGVSFLRVSWSLVIEEWFYIFTPIFLFFVIKWFKKPNWIYLSIIGFFIVEITLRALYVSFSNVPYKGIIGSFPFRFDALFVGVLMAFAYKQGSNLFKKPQRIALAVIGLSLIVFYISAFKHFSQPQDLIDKVYFFRTIGLFVLPFGFSLLLPFFYELKLNTNPIINKLILKFVTQTSLLTYAIYLIHMQVYGLKVLELSNSELINFLIKVIIIYLIAAVLYNFYEKPFLKLRERFVKV